MEKITGISELALIMWLIFSLKTMTVSGVENYSRVDFPDGFIFGAGTSAYQVEGAAFEDGRKASIWDTYIRSDSGNPSMAPQSTGDIACDQYHKYKEDVQLMVKTGLEAYRFSISWARLIPDGNGPVNPKGLQYYNNLINELIENGIQPHATLYHLDTPQALEDEYNGWLSRKMVRDFIRYADICFKEFGDRVTQWTTINEANIFAIGGYDNGLSPPGRCSLPFGVSCTKGDSSTEPYIAGHNLLLAHSSVVQLYRKKYKAIQHGFVGLNLYTPWYAPNTNSTEDLMATQRTREFYTGWLLHPLVFGDYPDLVKKNAGTKLPVFTSEELNLVKGAFDFLGLNHYSTIYIKDDPISFNMKIRDINADMGAKTLCMGTVRGKALDDELRVKYVQSYLRTLLDALRDGANTKGYFLWSFLDGFELLGGFKVAFGLYYVDLDDKELRRYPKLSAHWYSNFLKGRFEIQNSANSAFIASQ